MKKQYIIFDIEVTSVSQFIGIKIDNIIKHISLLDRKRLIKFIGYVGDNNCILVGYNNYGYDNKILNYCLAQKNLTSQDIINFSNSIINKTAKVKGTEFNIYVPDVKGATIENLDVFSMMGQKMSLKLKSFLKYNYLFKNALGSETLEDLKRYNVEDLSLTERIFYEEYEEEYELNLYLSSYLGFGEIGHKNLIISKFLKEVAKYNDKFDFRSCLDNAKLDEDLKYLAEKLIGNNKLTQLYTKESVLIKKGGIHFPIDGDFSKLGIQYYEKCYNYDFSSYYPNLYINHLDFFSPETKAYFENILGEPQLKALKNKKKEAEILEFVEARTLSNNKIKKLQELYSSTVINISELEPAIQNILTGTREGLRHDVLLFIMPYFKNYKKYSLEQIEDILIIWGRQSKMLPSEIKTQVRSLYGYKNMTAPYGTYDNELKREYGAFRLASRKNKSIKVCITNDMIKNFNVMDSQELKIYIALML